VTQKQIIQSLNDATLLFEKNIKVVGFKKATSTYRNMDAYYNRGLGIIVKRPACILEPRTPSFLCVPTTKLARGWVVQPIVQKTRLKEAVGVLEQQLKPYRDMGYAPDLHHGNVGWLRENGKMVPKMFDW
jgi:hypothetical protein